MNARKIHATREATPPPDDGAADSFSDRVRSLRLPEFADDEPSRRWVFVALGLLLLVGIVAGLYYAMHRRTEDVPATAPGTTSPSAGEGSAEAPVAPIKPGEIVLDQKGYIVPVHQIVIGPKVNGMIKRMRIEEGQRVMKNEILAELEDTDYQAEYDRAVATRQSAEQKLRELKVGFRPEEKEQARAELREVEAQLPQLLADWNRSKDLWKAKAISQQDYELADSKTWAMFRRAEKLTFALELVEEGPRVERIAAAEADLRQAQADVAKAKWRWDNCMIRASRNGTILKKNSEEGNIVNAIALQGSFSVCEMADLSDLEVDLSVQERVIGQVFKGQKCKIRAEAYPKRIYHGYVSRLMPIADRAKGSVSVRVKVFVPPEEEGVYLKPEMGVTVSFYNEASPEAPGGEDAIRASFSGRASGQIPLSLWERAGVRVSGVPHS